VDQLATVGVETSAVVEEPGVKTGVTVHLIRGTDRAMLTYAGSIVALRPDEIDETLLADTRHVHLGSYFLQRGVQQGLPEIFARAREAGATTSLDPGWDPEESWDSDLREVLAHIDVFMPNEQELLALAGSSILEDALEGFEEIPTVVVKRGEAGAVARANGSTVMCSPPRVDTVDTTGAGDSFDAGFLFGLLSGYDLQRALEAGCLCGALSTEKAGGVEAQPDLGSLRALVNREGGEGR
jgi:sugar/nucleoside kinase (ribokinase family)